MANPPMMRAAVRNTIGNTTRRSTRLGHKLVTLHVGSTKTSFAIHEDLLCSNSKYFKNLLQKGRKAVEGPCSICTDRLSGFAPISYCTTCGQNFHTKCLENWLDTEQTCPLCRAEWLAPQAVNDVKGNEFLECLPEDCLSLYVQWLYTESIPRDEEDGTEFPGLLVVSCIIGEKIGDEPFLKTVCKEIAGYKLAVMLALDSTYINMVYRLTKGNSAARKFIVDLYTTEANPPGLNSNYPHQFTIDVARALLSRRTGKDTDQNEVLAAYFPEEDADITEP